MIKKRGAMKPLILINFKTYPEAAGKKALLLAKKISAVKTKKYVIAVAPPILALKEVAQKTRLLTFAQYVDADEYGAHTGEIIPAELKKSGVIGALINHSEHRLPFKLIKKTKEACKKQHLLTIICAADLNEVKEMARLRPDYLAYEPKELIGGEISVTKSKPKIIIEAVKLVKKISPKTKVLCGAGVHSRQDLRQALELGTEGVLLAHAVVKAKNPKRFLEEFLL